MDTTINIMRADQAIAEWNAAKLFLDKANGNKNVAIVHIHSLIGYGITKAEAVHLEHLVRTLATEAQNGW